MRKGGGPGGYRLATSAEKSGRETNSESRYSVLQSECAEGNHEPQLQAFSDGCRIWIESIDFDRDHPDHIMVRFRVPRRPGQIIRMPSRRTRRRGSSTISGTRAPKGSRSTGS